MRRALALARRGQGRVEPNPMVGCVLVRDGQIVGEGFHGRYGGPHAEVEAIRDAIARSGPDGPVGSTCYVTLEPCSHYGKTPPCTQALLEAGVRRVVAAMRDPNPEVDGRGLGTLRESGLDVTENVLEDGARQLNAPYLTRLEKKRPWIVAKWAMTLDGKLATRTGGSSWISCESSRKIVHRLRARMDAILVGIGTAIADDPLLTVRPEETEVGLPHRRPLRIVLDSQARLSPDSRLVRTARETPVMVVVGPGAEERAVERLQAAGCELFRSPTDRESASFLRELARRGITNLLVEGGGGTLGLWFDQKLIDQVHVFIAPKLVGGREAVSPLGATGLAGMDEAARIESPKIEIVDRDVYVRGRVVYE